MILIVTALKIEADPFISYFRLKKNMDVTAFSIYQKDEVALVISGTGKLRAAIAATLLIAQCGQNTKNHLLVNVGFCGCFDKCLPIGSVFQIAKVSDMDTKRDYYPERFMVSELPCQSIACYSHIVREQDDDIRHKPEGTLLCDMESAGLMEVSARLLETHRVMILKIVSDHLAEISTTRADYIEMMASRTDFLTSTINKAYCEITSAQPTRMRSEISELLEITARSLRLTVAMRQILQSLLLRAEQNDLDPTVLLARAADKPVTTRSDRKHAFDQLLADLKEQNVSRDLH